MSENGENGSPSISTLLEKESNLASSATSALISASENLSVSSSERDSGASTLAPLGIPPKFDKRRTFRLVKAVWSYAYFLIIPSDEIPIQSTIWKHFCLYFIELSSMMHIQFFTRTYICTYIYIYVYVCIFHDYNVQKGISYNDLVNAKTRIIVIMI